MDLERRRMGTLTQQKLTPNAFRLSRFGYLSWWQMVKVMPVIRQNSPHDGSGESESPGSVAEGLMMAPMKWQENLLGERLFVPRE